MRWIDYHEGGCHSTCVKVMPPYLTREAEENYKKSSIRITGK
jgi:hypothetical protein